MTDLQVLSKIHDLTEGGEGDFKLQYAAFRLEPVRCFYWAYLPSSLSFGQVPAPALVTQLDELSTLDRCPAWGRGKRTNAANLQLKEM